MSEEELKPCPFCGNDNPQLWCMGLGDEGPEPGGEDVCLVQCGSDEVGTDIYCGASVEATSREGAIRQWNRREGA